MDYEQKYKLALERANIIYTGKYNSETTAWTKEVLEAIFPELAESEDERIRKSLIEYLKGTFEFEGEIIKNPLLQNWIDWLEKYKSEDIPQIYKTKEGEMITYSENEGYKMADENEDERIRQTLIDYFVSIDEAYAEWEGIEITDILAWLEKQGEQKPVDKVEPKFKVGDWVVNNNSESVCQVTEIRDSEYCLWPLDAEIMGYLSIIDVDNDYHLWTIQDAEDGDILWHSDTASNGIFIFKEIRHDGKVLCYCDYDSEDHFCNGEYHTCCWSNDKYIKPATKEQRDHLFEKMHEAGYEWDEEKKELRKMEQKPKWSEKDERISNQIIADIKSLKKCRTSSLGSYFEECINWLESLKKRMNE